MLGPERRQSRQEVECGRLNSENKSSSQVTVKSSLNLSIDLGQSFLENDSGYLQFLLTSIFPGGTNLIHRTGGRSMIVSAFRMDFTIGCASLSPSVRAALLVLGSYLKEGNDSATPLAYYQTWCTAANRDIVANNLESLVLSTYVMTLYASFKRVERDALLIHARQFRRILQALISSRDEAFKNEWSWYETLWQPVITTVYHATRESPMDTAVFRGLLRIGQADGAIGAAVKHGTVGHHLDDLKALADVGLSLFVGTNHFSIQKRVFRRLRSLIICLRVHFEHFLHQNYLEEDKRGDCDDVKHVAEELRQIMEIARLCPGVEDTLSKAYDFGAEPLLLEESPESSSNFLQFISLVGLLSPAVMPIRTALLYCSSALVKGLLDPAFDFDIESKPDAYRSALALCRVCGSMFSRPSVTRGDCAALARSLFWANLVLRKSTHPFADTWIKAKFSYCAQRGVLRWDELDCMLSLLREVEGSSSSHALWRIRGWYESLRTYSFSLPGSWTPHTSWEPDEDGEIPVVIMT